MGTSRALCNSNIQGIPDPGNSQDFPGIPGNSREYRPPIPVPKVGNGIFHSHSRSRKWEWNFMEFSFPFPKIGLEFSTWIPVPEKWEWFSLRVQKNIRKKSRLKP